MVSLLNFSLSGFKLFLAFFKLLSKDQSLVMSSCLFMHVIFTRSYTGRKGKVSVRCTLTHNASPQDIQPAGLLGAPLLNCEQCLGLQMR